jgi:UDP:flavonoid glycosyltransferase YjiC (YdhE family)
VPFVVVPFGNDQPDNAARCGRLGVSRALPRERYGRDRAAAVIGGLLDDAQSRTKAKDCARVLASEDGVAAACDALESLLK